MSGKPSKEMHEVMRLIHAGETPYRAAERVGIATATVYRSRLYKAWRDGTETPPSQPKVKKRK